MRQLDNWWGVTKEGVNHPDVCTDESGRYIYLRGAETS
jgi:hypothetical protein